MLVSFYFFIIPISFIIALFAWKFFKHRNDIKDVVGVEKVETVENVEEAKEIVFDFLLNAKEGLVRFLKVSFHFLLHFFVIFLKLISDLTDILYAKSRDFFLQTATREKDVVSRFWHTLKEYKKEKESQE